MQKKNKNIFFNTLVICSVIVCIAGLIYYMFKCTTSLESFASNDQIGVVYFAFLKEDRWRTIVLAQMQDLVVSGLAEIADIDIVLSGTEDEIMHATSEITSILSPVNNKVRFSYSYENTYEYPGIKKLYEKCNENPEKIYLYFHSKGMVFHDKPKRNDIEMYLFEKLINNWRNIIEIFEKYPDKNKVSLGCSIEGHCWFNFFWVRGSYLKNNCSHPNITEDRFYYELYLGNSCKNASYKDCYNMADNNKIPYYGKIEIAKHITDMGLPVNE